MPKNCDVGYCNISTTFCCTFEGGSAGNEADKRQVRHRIDHLRREYA